MSWMAQAGAAAVTTATKPAVNFIFAVGEVEACCLWWTKLMDGKTVENLCAYVSPREGLEVRFAGRLK